MISKAFQNVISQMSDIVYFTMGVMDREGVLLAIKGREPYVDTLDKMILGTNMANEVYEIEGYSVLGIGNKRNVDFIVFVQGTAPDEQRFLKMLAVSLANVRIYYDEKYDKNTFVQNIILDNLLTFDLYQKARELHIEFDTKREVYLIRTQNVSEINTFDILRGMFPDRDKDFVINIDDDNTAIVRELTEEYNLENCEKIAANILETLKNEGHENALVGISRVCDDLSKIANGFKEAQVALEVGKVFETEKDVLCYERLGIGRLIYQLPVRLCELFLDEIFKKGRVDDLDEETLLTIQKFFENDLNVSETSRQLFVHRNTLVYRLDKILKITGLDLRKFDQAIVFKVAMMVNKYLVSNPMRL